MNIRILVSLGIGGATAVIAVLQGHRLGDLREQGAVLEEKATALGIPVDGSPTSKSGTAPTAEGSATAGKGGARSATGNTGATPGDPEAEARAFAQELFAFAKRMKEIEASGEEPSREDRQALFAFLNRFLSLDPAILPHLMEEVRAYDGLEDDDKQNILRFAMMSMAQSDPERALDLFLESGDLLKDRESGEMVAMALNGWATQDPEGALDWLEENSDTLEPEVAGRVRAAAIANAFATAPQRAVKMALALERDQLLGVAGQLGRQRQSPQEKLDTLRLVQGQLDPLPSEPERIGDDFVEQASSGQLLHGILLVGVGQSLSRQSFEASQGFLDSANLSASEQAVIASGLAEHSGELQDPGSWIPWIHEHSPGARSNELVSNVVEGWTERDFRSTADWIGDQPDGPLKEISTYSFAETVAPHEPASAASWAATLPASENRQELMQRIHDHWSGQDSEAATEFAQQYDLDLIPPPPPDP